MRGLLLLVSLIAALAAASVAEAKEFTRLVVVGDQGRSTAFQGQEFAPWNFAPSRSDVRPAGRYLLLYPIIDPSFVGEPGRYFPDQQIACFSWDRTVLGECGPVGAPVAAQLNAAGLSRFSQEPTILSRLRVFGREGRVNSNGAVAIELAFNRWRLARRRPHRPADCSPVRATWSGPAPASRPTRFCLAVKGVWAQGRFYPAPHTWLGL
jgi:hypothetical protein